jgi:cobalt-zinc-cadmium efflux system membrane fusion protein
MSRRLFAVGMLATLLFDCRKTETPEKSPPPGEAWLTAEQIQAAKLDVQAAGNRTLTIHLLTAGRVAFDEARVAHVFSPVNGRVTRVSGELGSRVRAGESLAIIDSPDLGAAWSDMVKARADSVAADRELQRQRGLFEHQAAAEREYEAAQDNAQKAKAEIERAVLRLKMLHSPESGPATQEFLLKSPISGEIVNRSATPGLEVQGMLSSANVVQELFTVGDIDRVWVWGDVYERDLGKVRRDLSVAITSVADPSRVVKGTIDFVGDALDKDTHTARIRCVVPNRDHFLKPEMYVTLSIEFDRRDLLALPRAAVIRSGDRQVVFVENGKTENCRTRFQQRAVALGDADDGWVSIVSGLRAGERVVVSGSILLSAGTD